jgi:hypothetical protein
VASGKGTDFMASRSGSKEGCFRYRDSPRSRNEKAVKEKGITSFLFQDISAVVSRDP